MAPIPHAQQTPDSLLHSVFGFSAFRPGQQDIVERIVAGTNMLCVMPTGAGKSLCYQLPALLMDRLTVVVSPLVALMDDQVAGLSANGVAAARIHSNRDRQDNVADWRRVQSGAVKLLYLSPERLMTDRMLSALERLDPAMFVVDEAHCISKWGVSFRPDYEALSGLRHRFPRARLSAFTATADTATQRDIVDKLFGGKGQTVVHGFDRPNLWLGVAPKTDWRRQLLAFVGERRGQSGIVYCLSRRLTEEVTIFLQKEGFRALAYHAGLDATVRRDNQEIFMAEDGVVMVATIAFGMGIDKPDIRYVFHLNLPGSVEAYYQEIGRAGRDGLAAEVHMIFGLDDIRMRRQFIEQGSVEVENAEYRVLEHKRLDALLAYCEATQCRRVSLLAYFNETSEPCGNCDVCNDPPTLIDGTDEARALLGAVTGTGERFGAVHVVDVLMGSSGEKILARGHDRLASYGAGKGRQRGFWETLIRQAVAGGYLIIDIESYGGLRLTEKGRAVMDRGETFWFRDMPQVAVKTKKTRRDRMAALDGDIDTELFASLKAIRREIALERDVPAYVIFSDATLADMCRARPNSLDAFATINGVGPKKLKDFGPAFLAAILRHPG